MKAYSLGLYEKSMPPTLTFQDKLLAAKRAGYDDVEISIDQTEEKINRLFMPPEERLTMIRTMYETGISIRSMCVSALTKYSLGNEDAKLCQKGMMILKKSIELADDLGIRIIMIPGYDVYYEQSTPQTQKRFFTNLQAATLLAAKYGILLEMETMENSFMNTVWKAMYYVRQIDSAYLGIYPDAGNIKNAAVELGSDEAEDLRSGRGHITSLHLKETKPGIFRDIPYGEGHVDFEKIIAAAWSIGIRKFVAEFWYNGDASWQEELVRVHDMLTMILDKQEGAQLA